MRHFEIGEANDYCTRSDQVKYERLSRLTLYGHLSAGIIQVHLTAEKIVRIYASEQQVGIGKSGGRASSSITYRARVGAGALRSYVQAPALIHPGYTSTTGTDFNNVNYWYPQDV